MDNAKTDANYKTTIQGISSVDGEPTDIYVNPANGALLLET